MVKQIKHLRNFTAEERKAFREKYEVYFFDIDGTLEKLNGMPIPGVADTVKLIYSLRKTIHVITDTCLYNKDSIVKRVHRSFPFIKKENILTAPMLIVEHLKKIGFNKKIYAMGEENGLIKDLKNAGFEVLSDQDIREYKVGELSKVTFEEGVGAVVLGGDVNFNYMKLVKAVNYLAEPSTKFFVTHFPIVALNKPILPAAGALALPITAVSQKKPEAFSKGTPTSVEYIHSLGYDMKKCIFVGDGLSNDVQCGNKCGMDSLLVMSGTVTQDLLDKHIEEGNEMLLPTYVADSVADLEFIYKENDEEINVNSLSLK